MMHKAKEKYPGTTPRLISDNGPQFIARDFKQFVRLSGMDHARTSPYYPQSNGQIERWHGSLKVEAVRPKTPLSLNDARRVVGRFVEEYNTTRPSQRDRVHHAARPARGPAYADLGGSETANSTRPVRDAPPGANRRGPQPRPVHSGHNWDSSSR